MALRQAFAGAFQAIDDASVRIVFGVITPKRATGEHLKTLARVSRLLRNKDFRARLVASATEHAVFELIKLEEGEERTKVGLYLPATAMENQAVQGGTIEFHVRTST